MRRIIYTCDHCEKEFGENTHINVKQLQIAVSQLAEGSFNQWVTKHIQRKNNGEMHFCGKECFKKYINALEFAR